MHNTAIFVVLIALAISLASAASVYTGTPVVFSGSYTKFNPGLQGGGITTSASIKYDGPAGAFQLQYTLTGQPITEVYEFSPPFPTNGITTQCTPATTSTYPPSQAWQTFVNYPYSLGAPSAASPASGASSCASTSSSSTCAAGSRIYASSASGSTITYKIDRYDDTYPSSLCGCAVTTVCLPLPACVSCSQVSVSGGTLSCNSTLACSGLARAVTITVAAGSAPSFSVTMTGTTVGFGTAGLKGSAGSSSCVSCPTAVHTCATQGSGVSKYKKVNCATGGQQCEVSDNSDMLYWPLWYNTDYYNAGVTDSSLTFNGQACKKYTAKSSFTGTNLVTALWLLSSDGKTVCGWSTENGDTYTMTSFTLGTTSPSSFANNCTTNSCWKPLDIAFVVELSQYTTFQDVTNMQNWLIALQNYLHITPPETNVAIVTYSSSGVVTDLAQGVNTQQLQAGVQGGLKCCNTFAGDPSALCCNGPSSNLPSAIVQAATLLKNFPLRTYTSKNIVLLTAGGFTSSATDISNALAQGSTLIQGQAGATSPPGSAILNFDSLYFGSDGNVLNTLNQVKTLNDARNTPLYTKTQLSTAGLESGFDTVVNRVWNRAGTGNINDQMKEIIGGLCASNGGRSCGACCGDCTCGTICVPPDTCKTTNCYNVTLTPTPVTSSTCCNYHLYSCPGSTSNLCNSIQCDLISNVCTNQTKSCPASNACYTYSCNSNTGSCDPIPRFSDPNACYQAYCTAQNTVAYKPKVTCAPLGCNTVVCVNATGACSYTPNPQNPPTPCHVGVCTNNAWQYYWPESCTPSDPCLTQACDPSAQCINVGKCGASNTCTNVTCSAGKCSVVSCPAFQTTNNVVNKCRPYQSCTVNPSGAVYSTCVYSDVKCSVSDSACQTATCNPTTGSCVTTDMCPAYKNNDNCQPRLAGQCSNATGTPVCNYTRITCSSSDPCQNTTCNPTNGKCNTYGQICAPYLNNNVCSPRDNSSCSSGTCKYNTLTCTSTDRCKNTTCDATKGCALPDLCPLYQNSNKCIVRNNASCGVTLGCTYTTTNCTPADPCLKSTCQSSNGACTRATDVCPLYQGGSNKCFIRNNATCNLAPNCAYIPTLNCTNPNYYTTGACQTVGGVATCVNTSNCALFQGGNKCKPLVSYNGTCYYQDVTCSGTAPSCSTFQCDPATGTCSAQLNCQNSTANKCSFTNTCNAPCDYKNITCPTSSDPCSVNLCTPSNGICSASIICPQYQNGNLCINRTKCSPCTYATTQCSSSDPCATSTCNSKTGACESTQKCSVYKNNDLCQPRVNSSCSTGCTYTSVACTPPSQPCFMSTCKNGVCSVSANSSFNPQTQCTPPSDPCLVAVLNASDPTCCAYTAKCPNNNLCQTVQCNSGTCVTTNKTCPSINPNTNSQCDVNTGCSASTGQCTYGPKQCPAPPNPCQDTVCNNATGACTYVDTSRCVDPCLGITCSPVNCSNQACKNGTCVIVSDPPLCPPITDNTCAIGHCSSVNNFCTYTAIQPADCETQFGTAPSCYYWGTNPTFPGCCQLLPLCNSQIDLEHKCMLLTCNNDTNGQCVLVDNTAAVCPEYKDGDLCQPFRSCDNATGACTYDDLNINCAAQQAKVDPCFDGVCQNGLCVAVNTSRCIPLSPCLNVTCHVDACVKYVCNESDGNCILNKTTTCSAIDNCTSTICDPVQGCVPVPFNLTTCNVTDPCITVFANGTKSGCCDTRPTCPPLADNVCNPVNCTAGSCSYGNISTVCSPFQIDNTTKLPNKCIPLSGCNFGCLYSAKPCPPPTAACQASSCIPENGTCVLIDTCRRDACVQSTCNLVTGVCDLISTTQCTVNSCTNQTCVPALGCLSLTSVNLSSCPSTPCSVPILNTNKPGCCDTAPKCTVPNNCSIPACDSVSGNCTFTPFCAPKKCQDVTCVINDNGTPECQYSNKTCVGSSACEVALPCVEDGKPYECVTKPACSPSTDKCASAVCDPDAAAGELCSLVPVRDCNDNDPCTVDSCESTSGNCTHNECPSDDLCFPSFCNATVGCYTKPVLCNDFDACTNDTCFNGTCIFTPISCDSGDFCTLDSCDSTRGCVVTPKVCLLNETCAYDDPTDSAAHQSFLEGSSSSINTPCRSCECMESSCDLYLCQNQTCVYTKGSCNVYLSSAVVIGSVIGGGVLAGIIIAVIVAVAGCSGGAVYAYNSKAFSDNANPVMNNPLYNAKFTSGTNPLQKY